LICDADNITCLDLLKTVGMAEGLSDFFAMWVRLKSIDTSNTAVHIAECLQKNGICTYSYAISKEINPTIYDYLYKKGWA
jgi:hypothetical protein